MLESYSQMAERHDTTDCAEWYQEWCDRWAPRLSLGQCDYCWCYSLDSPAKGWLRVSKPDSETMWVERWKGFFVHCPACNPEGLGPEPGNPYNCLHCFHMQHDPCHYDPDMGPGDMTCYKCEILEGYVFGNMTADCGGEYWVPIPEVEPDV